MSNEKWLEGFNGIRLKPTPIHHIHVFRFFWFALKLLKLVLLSWFKCGEASSGYIISSVNSLFSSVLNMDMKMDGWMDGWLISSVFML